MIAWSIEVAVKSKCFDRIICSTDDEEIASVDLVALMDHEEGGFFKRLWDAVVLFFAGLFSGDTLSVIES